MFIDWIIPLYGWGFLISGCLVGILGAVSFQARHTEANPLRRAVLPLQIWIPVGLACFMIGVGAVVLLRPSLATIFALKPFIGVGLGIVGVALASATPLYMHRLWQLIPTDRLRRWRGWMLIALGMLGEGASLMGIGGGALFVMPRTFGSAFWAASGVLGLGMLVTVVGALAAFAGATYRFSEQYMA
jgi:hypothetical protein